MGVFKVTNEEVALKMAVPLKRHRRSKLTERDQKILSLLGEYGCVSAERIKSHCWQSSKTSRAHYRRLAVLRRMGLVENVMGDRSMTIGYRLTLRGKRIVAGMGSTRSPAVNRRSYKTQFEHDQILIDIRGILEKSPLVKGFRSEAEIRHSLLAGHRNLLHWENAATIPDGAFVFAVPGHEQKAALELELTPKKKQRYARIFRNHLLAKDWNLVFYIVKNEPFRKQLMQLLSDVKANDIEVQVAKRINGIYFCTLEEFLKRKLRVPFTNGKEEISFAEVAKNFGLVDS